MLVLALDSSAIASVALARVHPQTGAVEVLSHRSTSDTRSHAEVMAPFVAEVLDEARISSENIDAIVCGTGPGPFTGLRAGIVTARTLGFAWNVPVYGLMSLFALAEYVYKDATSAEYRKFLVATDARRREIYSAEFALDKNGYSLITGPTVGKASDQSDLPAYGVGAGLYRENLKLVEGFDSLQPDAEYLLRAAARLGIRNLSTDTTALYLRDSDAKVPAARKKASGSAL